MRPFVDAARVYALAQALPQTNTVERLRAAGPGARMSAAEVDATAAAFLAIQQLRLRHQASRETLTEDNANRIDPDTLNELERRMLKEAFRLGRKLQQRLALDHQL